MLINTLNSQLIKCKDIIETLKESIVLKKSDIKCFGQKLVNYTIGIRKS